MGYDVGGTARGNTYDVQWVEQGDQAGGIPQIRFHGVKMLNDPPLSSGGNLIGYSGSFFHTAYNNVAGDERDYEEFASIIKTSANGSGNNPTQRANGSPNVLIITPLSNISPTYPATVMTHKVWGTAGVTRTYTYYVQSTFTSLTSSQITLAATYLSSTTGAVTTATSSNSISTRTNSGDWSQYLTVTVTPAQSGWIDLVITIMGYQSGKYIWIDPQLVGSGYPIVQVYWKNGQSGIDCWNPSSAIFPMQ
jgi:hypothetical protein